MARRLAELPETNRAFAAGELSEDQVAVIARKAPASIDAEVAALARSATVTQLRRVLSQYSFPKEAPEPDAGEPAPPAETRRVSFDYTEEGRWRLSAELPADEGAVWEKALTAKRDELFSAGEAGSGPGASPADVSWADAFVAMAEASAAAGAVHHPHRDRHLVLLHLGRARATGGHAAPTRELGGAQWRAARLLADLLQRARAAKLSRRRALVDAVTPQGRRGATRWSPRPAPRPLAAGPLRGAGARPRRP